MGSMQREDSVYSKKGTSQPCKKELERIAENTVLRLYIPFKDAIPRRTVNQLLKRLVREICRRASVRAAHRKVRGYSTSVTTNVWLR